MKLRYCGDSPLCFEEDGKLFYKDPNTIYKSNYILNNLKHDYFQPWK